MGLWEENRADPPKATQVKWLFASGFGNGGSQALFLGREGDEVRIETSTREPRKADGNYGTFERLVTKSHVMAVQFSDPGNIVCLGSSSDQPLSSVLRVPLRDPSLAGRLVARFEEFTWDPGSLVVG